MLDPRCDGSTTLHREPPPNLQRVAVTDTPSRRLTPWLVMATLIGLTALRSGSAIAEPVALATGTVNSADGLNLRSGPGTSYGVVAVLPNGAVVTITGAATADNWLPVSYSDQSGWTDGQYLTLSAAPAQAAPAAPASGSAVVNSPDGLNLRDNPDTAAKIVTVIPGGATVSVGGGSTNGWTPVSYNGASGWVNTTYLSPPGSGTSATITANAGATSGSATLGAVAGSGATSAAAAAQPGFRIAWPTNSRRITTVFSPTHLGVDIGETSGTAVGAGAAGTVSFAGGDPCCSYGLYVIVDHGNGIVTLYAHMASLAVQKGQAVAPGQKLGAVGCTGRCTGPHIHLEVRVNGTQVDPLRYLPPPWNIE